jgi:hypothetical protein
MNDPIKIIWKYKNDNRRTQYLIYIFIGNVSKSIKKILDKISELNLYDTLLQLTKEEYNQLEKIYGIHWYNKFFNLYHINNTIYSIRESTVLKNEIIQKYSQSWYDIHIQNHQLMERKLIYSYESIIKFELDRKNKKKAKEFASGKDAEDFNDYTTTKKLDIKKIFNIKKEQSGGSINHNDEFNLSCGFNNLLDENLYGGYDDDHLNDVNDDEEVYHRDDDNDDDDNDDKKKDDDEKEEEEIDEEDKLEATEITAEEEIDLNEIEQIYKDADVKFDDNVSKTSTLIKEALNNNKIFEKQSDMMIEFDQAKDTNIYDEKLKDIFVKKYIENQFIYKDDTIKTIKDKLCISLKNNKKFGKSYLLPSRQYLWTEYYYDNKIEKIMLGQKWLRRNEILSIDIEPNNNLRMYEDLNGNLKTLRDNLKRYTSKIRREEDENNILYDYDDYLQYNEIYMIDLYNELGKDYKKDTESIKNLQDVYLKLYFYKVRTDELKNIIDYLTTGSEDKVEVNKMINVYESLSNDLIIENEIANLVEDIRLSTSYKKDFKQTHVIQSIIHLKLRQSELDAKIDLYRIFNEFIVSKNFPFILYQTIDGNVVYKFNEDEINDFMKKIENSDIITKWFENTPYGITIKFKINDKFGERFMGITISESGRLEYKIVFKEDDNAVIDDIKSTYKFVRDLIKKINSEKSKHKFAEPEDSEFKYAFINTVQKFELPEKYIINHNDLSEFSRYFYPYIALVIDPRKRQSKIGKEDESSKFGTYLKYKRVSKYDNQTRIEQRILYFLRNYEITDNVLINEISKQFNITTEKADEEIQKIKQRYQYLKKSRKILKKLENLPKYKSPGINIDIQGKQRDKYKIRISGARDKEQLNRMVEFMNILIYLYVETYLLKKPDRQELKEKLKKLNKIAKRRNKVVDIVSADEDTKTIKQMTKADKERIGYKPEEGQNQWSRCCQNSGEGKKRRPQQYNPSSMAELLKKGYKLNKKTGEYERRILVKNGKSSKKSEVVLKTLKFMDFDNEGNPTGNEIHYACDPEENGEHFYVGFLTKCRNPFGHCMPCCFKKDPALTQNKNKLNFYKTCQGVEIKDEKVEDEKNIMEMLYILQDTNKIQDGRFGLLPNYLDFYFNIMMDRDKYIKQHYLSKTKGGYFFKYGSVQDRYQFLNAIGSCINMNVEEIKNKIINILEKDDTEQLFTSLNNGDIKSQFGTKQHFINFIKTNPILDFDLLNNILCLPNVIYKNGMNIITFNKKTIIISKVFEKEKVREDFELMCGNIEDYYAITSTERENIFLLRDGKNYYPIVEVNKKDENDKSFTITKIFKYSNDKQNIMKQIAEFYQKNCKGSFLDSIIYRDSLPTAREILFYLTNINNKKYSVKYQVIDTRNKCKFFVTENNILVPTRPSGSIYNIQIVKSIDKYIQSFKDTYDELNKIYELTKKELDIKPNAVYYENKDGETIEITAIVTRLLDVIPVVNIKMKINEIEKIGLKYENMPIIDKIDNDIIKRKTNIKIDERVENVNKDTYQNESYELFRLEFSNYLNRFENQSLKNKIIKIIDNKKYTINDKTENIRLILYRLIDRKLYEKYKKIIESKNVQVDEETEIDVDENAASEDIEEKLQTGGKYDKLVHIANDIPDLKNYMVNNDRESCNIHKNKDECNINIHCHWTRTGCYMSLTKKMVIKFINKVSDELAVYDRKALEILKIDDYYVSDIVDYNKFTTREGQKIIRSIGSNIKKELGDIFGTENIPIIGKRKLKTLVEFNYQQLNQEFQLTDMKDYYLQRIIQNNLTIFRAYVNGYYWINNKYNDPETKNIGYYSPLQTEISNYFRGSVIEWIQNKKNSSKLNDIIPYMKLKKDKNPETYAIKIGDNPSFRTNTVPELYILSLINNIPIIVYNDLNIPIFIYDSGLKYEKDNDKYKMSENDINKYINKTNRNKYINIKFVYISNFEIPDFIEVLYFK